MATYNYDAIGALVRNTHLPILVDNIFRKLKYLTALMMEKAQTFNGKRIVAPLEYGDSSANADFTGRFDTFPLSPVDPITAAEYTGKMLTGTLTIALEDELETQGDEAVLNYINVLMKNLEKTLKNVVATRLMSRAATTTKQWNSLQDMVNITTIGGIPETGAVPDWWKSNMLNGASSFDNDARILANLENPKKDTFIMKMLQQGIAKSKYLTNELPDIIILGQQLWDLLEFIQNQEKRLKMNEKAASMGFNAIDIRGIAVVADDDLVAAQTGNTDGRIYFLNSEYLYFYFNSKAKFTLGKWLEPTNQNSKTVKINAFGNMVMTNRKAQTVITNVFNKKTYST